MQDNNEKEMKKLIDNAVDHSVNKAFRKYSETVYRKRRHFIKPLIILIVIVLVCLAGYGIHKKIASRNVTVDPVADHDTTLDNKKIFGFKAADFAEPILGDAVQKKLMIVEERSASVNTTITDAGFLNWGIFNKTQLLTYYGTGSYTVDLSKLSENDISLKDYVITVKIPHAELHSVSFDPSRTQIGDTEHGWLAFGSISLTADKTKKVEENAVEKLTSALNTNECLSEADRFARMSVTEEFQKLVSAISPVYRVEVEFQSDDAASASSDTAVSQNATTSSDAGSSNAA